jgi:hypothetical protein
MPPGLLQNRINFTYFLKLYLSKGERRRSVRKNEIFANNKQGLKTKYIN